CVPRQVHNGQIRLSAQILAAGRSSPSSFNVFGTTSHYWVAISSYTLRVSKDSNVSLRLGKCHPASRRPGVTFPTALASSGALGCLGHTVFGVESSLFNHLIDIYHPFRFKQCN
ncbi:9744_t:CDS:1, partial [Acaulospora colombiana]